jgi:hypothetical protein
VLESDAAVAIGERCRTRWIAAVPVEEKVNRLELHVGQRSLDERRRCLGQVVKEAREMFQRFIYFTIPK